MNVQNKEPLVSIIIPYHNSNYISECIQSCLDINYQKFEIIVVSDKPFSVTSDKIQVFYTGKLNTSPAEKNDIGIKNSSGEICAFINDDVFPERDWLNKAIPYFQDLSISAVCGPGITPKNNSLAQKASGYIYSSFIGGGRLRFRYIPQKAQYIKDFPSYNLLIRKDILLHIGGFNSTFYGGEDTKVCLSIIENGGKIFYTPDVLVYHHRRPVFLGHLKQIWNTGIHRGYFVKKYPVTSFKLHYFLPTTFLLTSCFLFVISLFNTVIFYFSSFLVIFFLLISAMSAISSKNIRIIMLVMLGLPLTHLTYGLAFILGLLTKKLER